MVGISSRTSTDKKLMDQDIAAETGFREYSSGHVTCRNDSVQMILENSSLQECSPVLY